MAILIRAGVTTHKRWGGITPSPEIPALFGLAQPPPPRISNSGQMHVACREAQVQRVEGELKWGSEESLQPCSSDIHAGVGHSGDAATVLGRVP